jgi:hypothetical protein
MQKSSQPRKEKQIEESDWENLDRSINNECDLRTSLNSDFPTTSPSSSPPLLFCHRNCNRHLCLAMELAQLEALCERLYNSQDSVERAHAENTLKCFSMNTEYISQCQYILDHALTPYALMLASSSLLKQVTEHSLALKLRLDICNLSFFLSFLYLFFILHRWL